MAGIGPNLLPFLSGELTALSGECRRKHPEIREASEQLGTFINELKDSATVVKDLQQNPSLLRPFVMGARTRMPRLLVISITALLRLIVHSAVSQAHVKDIFAILDETVSGVEEVQLKTLQCMMPLVTQFNFVHQAYLVKAYLLGLKLHASNSPTVTNAATAIIRQLLIWLFEKIVEEDQLEQDGNLEPIPNSIAQVEVKTNDNRMVQMKIFTADAFVIFQDICLLTNGERPLALEGVEEINKPFGLELIESVIAFHSKIFRKHPEFCRVLREKICTMMVNRLAERYDFAQGCRLWRVIEILIHEFHDLLVFETDIFFTFMVKILDEHGSIWERALVLEVLQNIFVDSKLTRKLLELDTKDSSALFANLIKSLNNQVLNCLAACSSDYLMLTQCELKVPCMQQFDKATPPILPTRYLLLLSFTALANWNLTIILESDIQTMHLVPIEQQRKSSIGTIIERYQAVPDSANKFVQRVKTTLQGTWGESIRMYTNFIKCQMDSEWRNKLTESLSNFIIDIAAYQMTESLDVILSSLVDIALPEMINNNTSAIGGASGSALLVNDANLNTSSLILQLGLCLDELLGVCWCHPIRVMHGIDLFAAFKAKKLQQLPPLPKNSAPSHSTAGSSLVGESQQQQQRRTILGTASSAINLITLSASPNLTSGSTNNLVTGGATGSNSSSNQIEMERLAQLTEQSRCLVENSKSLSTTAFEHYLAALCQLSAETIASDASFSSKVTIVLFPVQKLKQVILLNVHRLITEDKKSIMIWDIWMTQVLIVLNNPDPGLRGLGAEAFSLLINQMIVSLDTDELQRSQLLQERLINGIRQILLQCRWPDIYKMGLDSLYRIIQGQGQYLSYGWPILLNSLQLTILYTTIPSNPNITSVIQSDQIVNVINGENMTKISGPNISMSISSATIINAILRPSFTSVKLVCSDFLSNLSSQCIVQMIDLLYKFAAQVDDLNISLTAIGLFWDLSDHLRLIRIGSKTRLANNQDEAKQSTLTIVKADECFGLWLSILNNLTKLAKDSRPELRNSAVQTMSRTIENNGETLELEQWALVFDQIIIPLLTDIPQMAATNIESAMATPQSSTAITTPLSETGSAGGDNGPNSSGPMNGSGGLTVSLIHHSRNTIQKQWDETQVVMLHGVGQIYQSFFTKLLLIKKFMDWWNGLINMIECFGTSKSIELVTASIGCLSLLIKEYKEVVIAPHQQTNDHQKQHVKNTHSSIVSEYDVNLNFQADFAIVDTMKIWQRAWKTWQRIGFAMADSPAFTQETLLNFIRLFGLFYELFVIDNEIIQSMANDRYQTTSNGIASQKANEWCDIALKDQKAKVNDAVNFFKETNWIQESLYIIDCALRCETPSDPVRDLEHLIPLQQCALDQIERLRKGRNETNQLSPELGFYYLNHLCGWLRWVQELSNIKMTRIPSLRRIRPGSEQLSTAASPKRFSGPSSQTQLRTELSPISQESPKYSSKRGGGNGQANYLCPPKSHDTLTMPCYVSMAMEIVDRLSDSFIKDYREELAMYSSGGTFENIIKSLGRFMILKYRAPSKSIGPALWRRATNSFNAIVLNAIEPLSKVENLDSQQTVWSNIAEIVEKSMESNSMMVPKHLTVDQVEEDELFDIEQVDLICTQFLPAIPNHLPVSIVMRKMLWAINNSSKLYYSAKDAIIIPNTNDEQGDQLGIEFGLERDIYKGGKEDLRYGYGENIQDRYHHVSLVNDTVPVIKEKLAVTCLRMLFKICHWEEISTLAINNININQEPDEMMEIGGKLQKEQSSLDSLQLPIAKCNSGDASNAKITRQHRSSLLVPKVKGKVPLLIKTALPILMERCRGVINGYLEDRALLGKMPFPRVRQDEMVFILQSLINLRIPVDVMEENKIPVSGKGNDGIGNTTTSDYRRLLLNTPIGHLFYLYAELVECMKVDDCLIVPLIHCCFSLMGAYLGLIGPMISK